MSKHKTRLADPQRGMEIYRAKMAYQKFLEGRPFLRGNVRLKIGKAPKWLRADMIHEGDKVYRWGDTVLVELDDERQGKGILQDNDTEASHWPGSGNRDHSKP